MGKNSRFEWNIILKSYQSTDIIFVLFSLNGKDRKKEKNLTLSTTIAIVIVERAIIIWRAKKKTINVHMNPLQKMKQRGQGR